MSHGEALSISVSASTAGGEAILSRRNGVSSWMQEALERWQSTGSDGWQPRLLLEAAVGGVDGVLGVSPGSKNGWGARRVAKGLGTAVSASFLGSSSACSRTRVAASSLRSIVQPP
jgi:hypothetical protein